MKKTISILLCLLLILSSVSLCFADFTTTDSNNLTSIKNAVNSGGGLYNIINNIYARLSYSGENVAALLYAIRNKTNDLYNALFYNSNSIAHLVSDVNTSLSHIGGFSSTDSTNLLDILNFITYFSDGGARQSWLQYLSNQLTNIYNKTDAIRQTVLMSKELLDDIAGYQVGILGHQNNIDTTLNTSDTWSWNSWTSTLVNNNTVSNFSRSGNILTEAIYGLQFVSRNVLYGFTKMFNQAFTGYSTQQTATNWLTLQNSTFTPTSQTNGLYSWLSNIQTPIARLAYVHASDEEIVAREKAAANQDAVVDNFIDSTGSGAAPASSFGSVASMSSGYTSNMNTDAQASGIWNIFNSNNFGWFSQETANQLDTTVSTRKGSSDFDTPLLDQQIADIYKELGVDVND